MIKTKLVGYFPRRTNLPVGLSFSGGVSGLCSVSHCLNPAPENWVERWRHNDLGFFNTRDDAWSIVPPHTRDFRLFAYALVPMRFLQDREEPLAIRGHVGPLPASFVSLGMADEVPVNRFCLLATLTEAITFAQRCAREEPEPGPFYVIEVLREGG